ncbi:glycoside hydrolase [Obba rivulosa]|uniref:Alpha-galactosidase n=1 Tax=Obba rivulosa TaxID=1052685 RepID=A0A8E2J7A0_9APHY|nr:glycoside hydrolase [Obba rivulosa]
MRNALLSLLLGLSVVTALDNGLAVTPQMGWNTWNHFGCSIDEDLILSAANAMIQNDLPKYGYNYVNMDDCWQGTRNASGAPQPDPTKFPNGIKAVADQIHAMGLKFGLYSDAGTMTCGGHFGSLGFEEIDAQTYAEWGVDYLKYDNCYNQGLSGTPKISYDRYNNMSVALNNTGRPILYSMCNWGEDGPWNFATTIANSWRISGDVYDNYNRYDVRCPCDSMIDCKLAGFHCAMTRIIDFAAPVGQKAGPGHWNDLDMLEVGNGGMSYDEYVTHFSMWALLKSPLILGNDVTNMTNETLSIITNDAIIAVSQDAAGSPATRQWKRAVSQGGDLQLWSGSLVNYQFIIALLNTSPTNQTVDVDFEDVFIDQGAAYQSGTFTLYDLWQKDGQGNWGKEVGTYTAKIPSVHIGSHQVKIWKATLPSGSSKRNVADL